MIYQVVITFLPSNIAVQRIFVARRPLRILTLDIQCNMKIVDFGTLILYSVNCTIECSPAFSPTLMCTFRLNRTSNLGTLLEILHIILKYNTNIKYKLLYLYCQIGPIYFEILACLAKFSYFSHNNYRLHLQESVIYF